MIQTEIKILIVDDDKDVQVILKFILQNEGYKVFCAKNGFEALEMINSFKPHLILLDLMLPMMDGFKICSIIRGMPQFQDTIIVFISEINKDDLQIKAFDYGGDDYIIKPVNAKVLISKIKVLLNRHGINRWKENDLLVYGSLIINAKEYSIVKDNCRIQLTLKEFEILKFLAFNPNHVFSREEIFENVWENGYRFVSRSIDVHIRKIRQKTKIENIKTLKDIGYKFESYASKSYPSTGVDNQSENLIL